MFSKEFIKHRTRFGPLQAPKKKGRACRSSSNIDTSTTAGRLEFRLFKGDRDRGPVVCLNTVPGNEDFCNWMVLVAPARDHQQQNLVAFQYNAAIYFVTTKVREIIFIMYTKWNWLINNVFTRGISLFAVHVEILL